MSGTFSGRRGESRGFPLAWKRTGEALALSALLSLCCALLFSLGAAQALVVGSLSTLFFGIPAYLHGRQGERLVEASLTDPLTGIGNRRALFSRLEQAFASCARGQSELAVLMMDVDKLKEINDRASHKAGDAALRTVARALQRSTRRSDEIGRIGGDEFLVIAPGTSESAAKALAERIQEELRASPVEELGAERVGLSIGIATIRPTCTPTESDLDSLVQLADLAMYARKRRAASRVRHARGSSIWRIRAASAQ
jgi:diguanylate cyclase (GGDEF)-like protein